MQTNHSNIITTQVLDLLMSHEFALHPTFVIHSSHILDLDISISISSTPISDPCLLFPNLSHFFFLTVSNTLTSTSLSFQFSTFLLSITLLLSLSPHFCPCPAEILCSIIVMTLWLPTLVYWLIFPALSLDLQNPKPIKFSSSLMMQLPK